MSGRKRGMADEPSVPVEHCSHRPGCVEQGLHPPLVLGLRGLRLDQAGDIAVDRHSAAQPAVLDDRGDRDVGVQHTAVQCPLPDSPRNITPSTHLIVAFIICLIFKSAKITIKQQAKFTRH